MIVIGAVLLIAGFLLGIGILWEIGAVVLLIGLILLLLGATGHAVGGRRYYYLAGRLAGGDQSARGVASCL